METVIERVGNLEGGSARNWTKLVQSDLNQQIICGQLVARKFKVWLTSY